MTVIDPKHEFTTPPAKPEPNNEMSPMERFIAAVFIFVLVSGIAYFGLEYIGFFKWLAN